LAGGERVFVARDVDENSTDRSCIVRVRLKRVRRIGRDMPPQWQFIALTQFIASTQGWNKGKT
jgi:hypothetical protein